MPLSSDDNPAYFTVQDGDIYTHYDPIEVLASGYATGLACSILAITPLETT